MSHIPHQKGFLEFVSKPLNVFYDLRFCLSPQLTRLCGFSGLVERDRCG